MTTPSGCSTTHASTSPCRPAAASRASTHLGIQTGTEEELVELKAQAEAAGMTLLDVGETSCCHARSDKYWLADPQCIAGKASP